MSNSAEKFFESEPDAATRAKVDVFVKYFGIYFILMDSIRKQYAPNAKIKYIDLFSGRGFFEWENGSFDSTPLQVLNNVYSNNYENVEFYFNELNSKNYNLLKERVEHDFPSLQNRIHFLNDDARCFEFTKHINSNDITISLIDPFGYYCLNKDSINKFTNNKYSDVVCYLNYSHINRYITNEREQENFKILFGDRYNDVVKTLTSGEDNSIDKARFVLSSWIKNINSSSPIKYFLPIFIHSTGSASKIESIVIIVSKDSLGLKRLRGMLKDFEILDGHFYSYINSKASQNNLFSYEDYNNIYQYIDYDFINCSLLSDKIDKKMIRDYGYLSSYSEEYIKKQLKKMEEQDLIEIEYHSTRKRKAFTFGDATYFRRKN